MIRKACLSDVKDISRIHALSWKEAYKGIIPQDYLDNLKDDFWVEAFTNWINKQLAEVLIIFDNTEPVGCIAYGKARDDTMINFGEIISIYIIPSYFRKGFGKILLKTAIDNLNKMGFNDIYLWVLENNTNAKKFYKKYDFIETNDKINFEISGKKLTDLRYIYHTK